MKKLLFLLFTFFLVISCSSDNDPEDNRANQYPVNVKLSTIFSESEIENITSSVSTKLYIPKRSSQFTNRKSWNLYN